ncbi:MAG: oligopeptidase B [Bacteroidetes bacterium GWE2_41_25]|nr:MAG: oligopeptidase B [Bacteroidetes bacterium GWE2_41_25]HCU20250.1 oligopeptidase B [Bacteroidales bacterium]
MKRTNFILTFLLSVLIFACSTQPAVKLPVAEKIPHDVFDKRIDNYFWLRLSDEQKNAPSPDEQAQKVIKYLNDENEYTKAVLKSIDVLQKKVFDEIVGRIKKDDSSVPYLKNGYYYYNKFTEGNEYPVYYRRKGSPDAPEEIILDVNKIAEGKEYCSVAGLSVSRDNKILAYGTDFVSRRRYTINFLNLETGTHLPDKIENTTGQAVWAADGKTLFYVDRDIETLRAGKIFKHKLGSNENTLVYSEEDETYSVYLQESRSERYIFINSSQTLATEVRYLEIAKPDAAIKLFEPRKVNHEYNVDHLGNMFYIRTNADSSPNFKLMTTPEGKTAYSNWTDIIPHRSDVLFENFELFDNYLVAEERIKGLTNLKIIRNSDKNEHYLDFGEETYMAGISINPEPDTEILRFSYSSLTTPNSVIDYNMSSKEKKIMKEEEVLGGFDKNNYESKRLWAKAGDGTMVPVSIVYRKGFVQDGKSPLLLYAYGSYGSSTDAGFRSAILSLLDRGFVFALAHVRGGSEMGRFWYEDGKLLKKINTFTDFNDCAQFLVDQKYTGTGKLFAMGGSAGGLLMGAIVNMKPELYKGVIAAVPFVDVVSTMLDETIPLTTFEWDEWGDPRKKEYYDYMLSYSPYDQVKPVNYPNLLVTTGFWDSQVQYWEPAKWVAKLRDMKTDNNMLVMDVNMSAGHGGASGRFERYRVTALEYTFIIDLAGIKE